MGSKTKIMALACAAILSCSSIAFAQGGNELPSNAKGAQQKEGEGAASGSAGQSATTGSAATAAPSGSNSSKQTETGGNPGGPAGHQ